MLCVHGVSRIRAQLSNVGSNCCALTLFMCGWADEETELKIFLEGTEVDRFARYADALDRVNESCDLREAAE